MRGKAPQVRGDRYANATEVTHSVLRLPEEHDQKLEALRNALIEGEESGVAGPLDMNKIKRQPRQEAGPAQS